MTKFNADFWETTLASESWEAFSNEDALWHRTEEEQEIRHRRAQLAENAKPELSRIVDEVLTERQREVVKLYFFGEQNQRQIAESLGMSQQTVSEHLYGKIRNGHAVGGAIRKLQAACVARGIRWL
jgi:RNA polymerase sigma factor (sigma-70 family)